MTSPNQYDHLSNELMIVADGTATGRKMANVIVGRFALRLSDPSIASEIIELVVEDLEGWCLHAGKSGVPKDAISDWRDWYRIGYELRIEEALRPCASALPAINAPFRCENLHA